MAWEICSIGPDDLAELARTVYAAFGQEATDDKVEHERLTVEYDRWLGVAEGGRLVGGAGAYSFDLTLPGAVTAPAAGVTWVGVLPTHRRQGILTAMMAHQLADVADRGEPLAILTASEALIYGRFGYGNASRAQDAELKLKDGAFLSPPAATGACRFLWDEEVEATLPPVYDAWRRRQAGAISRRERYWQQIFADPAYDRSGYRPMTYVVHESDQGRPDGYVRYRMKETDWDPNVARVLELIALDPEVAAALWRFVLDLDLTEKVEAVHQPLDDPLHWRLVDSRAYEVKAVYDWLWVRVLDTPAALTGRRYATEGSLILDITDPFRPEGAAAGRYALDAGPDGATCKRLDAAGPDADITLDVNALGAAYLGGVRFSTLASAGRVAGDADALLRADAMFRSTPLPFCNSPF